MLIVNACHEGSPTQSVVCQPVQLLVTSLESVLFRGQPLSRACDLYRLVFSALPERNCSYIIIYFV